MRDYTSNNNSHLFPLKNADRGTPRPPLNLNTPVFFLCLTTILYHLSLFHILPLHLYIIHIFLSCIVCCKFCKF